MSDKTTESLRHAILERALEDIAFDGWTNDVLHKAGAGEGVSVDELDLLFPRGSADLLEAFSHAGDAHMARVVTQTDLSDLKIRERITLCIMSRIEYSQRHREASLRAASVLALPTHSVLAAKLLAHSVDAAWRSIGDTSTDFNFYTKRATLSLVLSSSFFYWMSDLSEDLAPTRAFVDRRIENVMQFEKAKAKVKKKAAGIPPLAGLLAKVRYAGQRFKA